MRAWMSVVIGSVVAFAGSPARADIKSDLYGDAKTVIEDLITKEVAENTVEEIACRAGHFEVEAPSDANGSNTPRLPADVISIKEADKVHYYQLQALTFLPGTMRRLYAGQFSGLKATLRAEAADLGGHLVYLLLETPTAGGKTKVDKALSLSADVRNLFAEDKKAKRTTMVPDVDALLTTSSQKPDFKQDPETLMIARIAEPPSDEGGTLYRFLDSKYYGAMSDGRHQKCKDAVLAKLKDGLGSTPSQLDAECSSAQTGTSQGSFRCEIADAVRSAILDDDANTRQHLVRGFSLVINADNTDALATAVLTRSPVLAPSAEMLKALDDLVNFNDDKVRAAAADKLKELNALVKDWKTFAPLVNQLRLIVASPGHFDMARVRAVASVATQLCNAGKATIGCAEIDALSNNEALKRLMPLLEAAMRGDTQETIHLAIETVLQRNRSDAACDNVQRCQKSLYETFFETLAYYVVDASLSGTVSEDTRAAFRSAAEDVIRHEWPGGFQRGGYHGLRIRPDFALRTSWNEGYVSNDGSSYRTVAAIPWLMIRGKVRYTPMIYIGVEASLLDLLGPLAEFSLRPNAIGSLTTKYDDNEDVWLNFFAPRVAVELGLPPLSTHLMVDVGASFRTSIAYSLGTTTDMSGVMHAEYDYHVWHDVYKPIELSLSLKYVP